jgi:hypothetical protein
MWASSWITTPGFAGLVTTNRWDGAAVPLENVTC